MSTHTQNLSVSYPFSRSKTSRNIQYERWTAVPYRHPKEKKSLTASEMVVYDFFTYCVGTNPHHTEEIESEDYIEFCSMTSWLTCKAIAAELEMPTDSVRKAKNRLIKLGWIRIIWFEGNNRSGNFQIGIPQCQTPLQLASERSGKFLPDTTYSNIEPKYSPKLDSNTNSNRNAKEAGDSKEFKKQKSINQGDLEELNRLFEEAIIEKPTAYQKSIWSRSWQQVIPRVQSVLKMRLNANLSHKTAVEFIKSIIPKMRGKSTLARFPNWFVKTESNGREAAPVWGLDFVFSEYHKRQIRIDEYGRLKQPAAKRSTDFQFWQNVDFYKRLPEKQEIYQAEIVPIPVNREVKKYKPKPKQGMTRAEAIGLDQLAGVELSRALQDLKLKLKDS